jgi:hypothetical protein
MLFLALLAVTPFQFHVDAAEFPNVVYHVSCLSDRSPCTKREIEKFWHEDLHWTDLDQRQLDAWNSVLDGVGGRQPKPLDSPFLPNYSSYYASLTAVRRIIAAGLDSRSRAEFRKRAAALASANEIAQLSNALEHFQRRLRPWWKSRGQPYVAARRQPIQSLMNAPDVAAVADRIARFMESETASREFRIDLIPRNNPRSDAAIATFVGNHLLLELIDAMEKPKDAIPVFMHELTHALYELAPLSLHQKLIGDFAAASEPQSQALYTILNEGIATGVQLTLLNADGDAAGQSDQDAYRHPFIPRIGRAVSAPLRAALENGPTLFHGFLESYLRACAIELKEEMASPRFILLSAILFPIGELDAAEKAYHSYLTPIWSASPEDRGRFPEVNIVFLITYDKLDAIAGNWDEIVPLSQRHRGFAFSAPRNSKGRIYVLAGRDDMTVAEVVKHLAAIRTGTGDGLVLSVD